MYRTPRIPLPPPRIPLPPPKNPPPPPKTPPPPPRPPPGGFSALGCWRDDISVPASSTPAVAVEPASWCSAVVAASGQLAVRDRCGVHGVHLRFVRGGYLCCCRLPRPRSLLGPTLNFYACHRIDAVTYFRRCPRLRTVARGAVWWCRELTECEVQGTAAPNVLGEMDWWIRVVPPSLCGASYFL